MVEFIRESLVRSNDDSSDRLRHEFNSVQTVDEAQSKSTHLLPSLILDFGKSPYQQLLKSSGGNFEVHPAINDKKNHPKSSDKSFRTCDDKGESSHRPKLAATEQDRLDIRRAIEEHAERRKRSTPR